MASTTLSDAAAIAECAATIALVNAGAGPGKLQLMSAALSGKNLLFRYTGLA